MMRVPKSIEVCPTVLLDSKPDHNEKDDGHDPTSDALSVREGYSESNRGLQS